MTASEKPKTLKAAVGINEGSQLIALNANQRCHAADIFEQALLERIVAQNDAVMSLSQIYQVYLAKLSLPGKPIGTLLFLGPTGSGKTRSVEAAAEILFGDPLAVVKIDCAEFQHSHEISKLIGSPPGYLGHRETIPLLSQENIDRFHTPKAKLTLLLFDEIEKASDSLWNLLLGILDKATLTLGDNRRVDFSNCIVVMTSNLGAREMSEAVEGRLGFTVRVPETAELDSRIEKIGIEAARRKFSPEFMNRLDKVVVFRSLAQEALEQILNIEIATIQRRIIASGYHDLVITCSSTAKSFLLNAGFDRRYGARPLKRVMEKYLVIPLSNLVATKQVGCGDVIYVDHDDTKDGLRFMKLPGVESEKRTMNAQASFNIGQLTI